MALIGSIAINMKLMTRSFTKGVGSARKSLNNLVGQTVSMNRLLAGASLAGAGVGLYKVAKSASNLEEQSNRARVMFGEFAGQVIKQADLMAGAFGTSRTEFLASTSAMAGMFQAAGYDKQQAADLSIHFQKLATDLSSLANIPVADALEKIQSGLAGEVRPLREVGVFMSEAAVKAEAAKLHLVAMGGELSESQKIQARTSLITKGLAFAQGDLARTANSAENATRGFMGRVENLAQTIGTALLPIVGRAMSELQVGVDALSVAWKDWTAGVLTDQTNMVGAVGETAASMGWLQKSVGFVADAFQVLKIGFYAAQSFITGGIGRIVSGLAGLVGALDSVLVAVGGVKTGIGDFLQTYGNDLKRLSEKQYETFQAQLAAPAASEGVNAAFAAAQERIKGMRAEAMKPGIDVSKITPANAPTMAAGAPKFASAAVLGSAEATNAQLRSRYGAGAGGKKPEEETAKNTRRLVQLFEKIGGAAATGGLGQAQAQAFGGGALLAGNF